MIFWWGLVFRQTQRAINDYNKQLINEQTADEVGLSVTPSTLLRSSHELCELSTFSETDSGPGLRNRVHDLAQQRVSARALRHRLLITCPTRFS